jgi:hypothetical protein
LTSPVRHLPLDHAAERGIADTDPERVCS